MNERLMNVKKGLDDMEQGNLKGLKPVDFQIILVIVRYLLEDGKALTFSKNAVAFFERHGFKVTTHIDGINWLITA